MPAEGWDRETDVVVLGFGAAGCAAALEARAAGADVMVLEKAASGGEGGNTRVSGNVWFFNRDPALAATYLRALCGSYPIPEDVIAAWASETYRLTDWVESLGGTVSSMDAPPDRPELDGSDVHGGFRHVGPTWGNSHLWNLLSQSVKARGIDVWLGVPGRDLVKDSAGAVVGVVAERNGQPIRLRARRGVVIATGGFENNPEMARDFLGLPDIVPWGSPAGTGDGHAMALRAGASLWHMHNMFSSFGIRVPGYSSGFHMVLADSRPCIYVDLDGRRFIDETIRSKHGHALINGRYCVYPQLPFHAVFDEVGRLAGPLSPSREEQPYGWNNIIEGYRWSDDNLVEIEKGWVARGETPAELARAIGISPHTLEATIEEFNLACELGRDPRFDRAPETLVPLAKPPFYSVTWGSMVANTNGGPRRNGRSQVLDTHGRPIPRLYAAGAVSSTYSMVLDRGFSIADALAFGRIAGRNAAAEA
ncbi:MAG TPA: FAD-dependent oxidoreductase [Candidatus Dormibacteraeota bacterium]